MRSLGRNLLAYPGASSSSLNPPPSSRPVCASSFIDRASVSTLPNRYTAGHRAGWGERHQNVKTVHQLGLRTVVSACAQGSDRTNMWNNVQGVYEEAIISGAISKIETQVEFFWDSKLDVEYIIRVAAALNKKPKGDVEKESGDVSKPSPPPRNPFLPYEEALWVDHLSHSHTLLLNKFNVVPHHLLAVTREFESQQDPLNAKDLDAAWKVLQILPNGGVAFYNCGEHSGRSQPHKHLQIVPLPLVDGRPPAMPVQKLIGVAASASGASALEVFEVRQLPFTFFAAKLPSSATPQELEQCFSALFKHGSETVVSGATLSYNVLMTKDTMALVPRSKETVGPCAINSLGFAGTVLVRSEEDAAYVRNKGPTALLEEVGVAWK